MPGKDQHTLTSVLCDSCAPVFRLQRNPTCLFVAANRQGVLAGFGGNEACSGNCLLMRRREAASGRRLVQPLAAASRVGTVHLDGCYADYTPICLPFCSKVVGLGRSAELCVLWRVAFLRRSSVSLACLSALWLCLCQWDTCIG